MRSICRGGLAGLPLPYGIRHGPFCRTAFDTVCFGRLEKPPLQKRLPEDEHKPLPMGEVSALGADGEGIPVPDCPLSQKTEIFASSPNGGAFSFVYRRPSAAKAEMSSVAADGRRYMLAPARRDT